MKVPQMIAAEFRRLTSSRMSVIALIALVCVPVIYGGLYLWANQDPYAKLSEIPVALVVDDVGGTDGNKGDDVADTLVDAATFDWHEVSATDCRDRRRRWHLRLQRHLPRRTFTADLESSSTDDPRKAEVVLSTNDANSYLASTIGEQAVKTIQTQIVRSVGENAAITFLDSLSEIRGKLAEAADGASKLADGAAQAGGRERPARRRRRSTRGRNSDSRRRRGHALERPRPARVRRRPALVRRLADR